MSGKDKKKTEKELKDKRKKDHSNS